MDESKTKRTIINKESGILGGIAVAVIGIVIALFAFSGDKTSSPATVDKNVLTRADSYSTGSASPKVKVVEFGDYQCPACGAASPLLKALLAAHSDLQLTFRDFPLTSIHKNAMNAALAANAAAKQGQFWPMNDVLYEHQNEWADSDTARVMFAAYAKALGLNADQFQTDSDSAEIAALVKQSVDDGTALSVNATPTLYFNGVKYTGGLSKDAFEQAYQKAAK